MPWSQTSPMDQRTQFIADYLREIQSVTELCDAYGISRKTGCKWIERYLRQGSRHTRPKTSYRPRSTLTPGAGTPNSRRQTSASAATP